MKRLRASRGFTLIEMIVVVLIMGILAALAVPSYLQSVENTKADDAVGMVSMIGTTNRMFALDHNGVYVTGDFPAAGGGSCAAGGATCTAPWTGACKLVACKYLADQDWGTKAYDYSTAGNATGTGACTIASTGGSNVVACAKRRAGAFPGTASATYNVWWYSIDTAGVFSKHASAPTPTI